MFQVKAGNRSENLLKSSAKSYIFCIEQGKPLKKYNIII